MEKKSIFGGILALLLIGGVVGSIGYLSKGFKDFDYKTWFTKGVSNSEQKTDEDIEENSSRQNIRKFDFKTNISGKMETSGNQDIVTFMNSCITGDPIIESVRKNDDDSYKLVETFKDKELGLRLGTDEKLGSFDVSFVGDYKFNNIQITCINYGRKRGDIPNVYNKQSTNSRFKVNGSSEIKLLKDEDLSIPYEPIVRSISYDTLQDHLEFVGIEGRPCILAIEMWVI
ncbi:MAG: hypothetical protein MJ222_01945 [Bacilli bacterium]|nr:hypothetical protein [Bacilli bacterium]